mmetsp:Transcript_17344/g.39356  ORF Transcript_17344/g.39356 Transcript_17344/m.39356 type:complete len:234 (+) Transcript_17344:406-1107(+)
MIVSTCTPMPIVGAFPKPAAHLIDRRQLRIPIHIFPWLIHRWPQCLVLLDMRCHQLHSHMLPIMQQLQVFIGVDVHDKRPVLTHEGCSLLQEGHLSVEDFREEADDTLMPLRGNVRQLAEVLHPPQVIQPTAPHPFPVCLQLQVQVCVLPERQTLRQRRVEVVRRLVQLRPQVLGLLDLVAQLLEGQGVPLCDLIAHLRHQLEESMQAGRHVLKSRHLPCQLVRLSRKRLAGL